MSTTLNSCYNLAKTQFTRTWAKKWSLSLKRFFTISPYVDKQADTHTYTAKHSFWKFQEGARQNVGKLAGRSRGETMRYCSQWSFMLPGGKNLFSMLARRGFTSTPFLWARFLFSLLGNTSLDPEITSCIVLAYGSISCPAKQRVISDSSDGARGSSLTSGKVSAQLVQRLCKKLKTSDLISWFFIVWTGFFKYLKSTGGDVCPSLALAKSFSKRRLPECRLPALTGNIPKKNNCWRQKYGPNKTATARMYKFTLRRISLQSFFLGGSQKKNLSLEKNMSSTNEIIGNLWTKMVQFLPST